MPRESEIISRFKTRASMVRNTRVLIGIGDDAAVVRAAAQSNLIACCDLVVEGVHFRRDWSDPFAIGYKALAATVSDVAAMGGIPLFALVSMALPRETPSNFVDRLIEGLFSAADSHGVSIIGGDTSSSPGPLFIDTTVLGECDEDRAVPRSGAQPGDLIFVTGSLGASEIGLRLLEQRRGDEQPNGSASQDGLSIARAHAINRHTLPQPRVKAGAAIGEAGLATAMIDISDGLSTDLNHLVEASGCGAVIQAHAIPVADCVPLLAAALGGMDPLTLALNSGEEYELLFASQPKNLEEISRLSSDLGLAITPIGEITRERGVLIENGTQMELAPGGWEHLV